MLNIRVKLILNIRLFLKNAILII